MNCSLEWDASYQGITHACFLFDFYLIFVSVPPDYNSPTCAISPAHDYIVENESISLSCTSKGAFPTATLKIYNGTSTQLLGKGDQEHGVVSTFTVSKYDNEKPFYCIAENEATMLLARTPKCSLHFPVQCEYRCPHPCCLDFHSAYSHHRREGTITPSLYSVIMYFVHTDKPYITQFQTTPSLIQRNAVFETWCVADSYPPATITVFKLSDAKSSFGRELSTNTVQLTTNASCRAIIRLKCQAENVVGTSVHIISRPIACESFGLWYWYQACSFIMIRYAIKSQHVCHLITDVLQRLSGLLSRFGYRSTKRC